jgi:hypothetical protein
MGYETKLHVAIRTESGYCEIIASINLCKAGEAFNELTKQNSSDHNCYYFTKGETEVKVTTDDYERNISVMAPTDVLDCLKSEIDLDIKNNTSPYRRFLLAQSLISNILETFPKEDIVVLGYGY